MVPHWNRFSRQMRSCAGVLVLALSCSHCGKGKNTAYAAQDSAAIRDLAQEPQYSFLALASGLPRASSLVIREEKTWRHFWESLIRSGTPSASLPRVDFERKQVLVASLGPKNAGHDVRITHVQIRGDTLYTDVL